MTLLALFGAFNSFVDVLEHVFRTLDAADDTDDLVAESVVLPYLVELLVELLDGLAVLVQELKQFDVE